MRSMDTQRAGVASEPALASATIDLAAREPLTVGRLRVIHAHPTHPDCLIKTVRPDVIEWRWGAAAPWYKRRVRTGQYTVFLRELREYLAVRAQHPANEIPIVHLMGLVETDLGVGLVVEKVRDANEVHGALAPTLTTLCTAGGRIEPWVDDALAQLLDALLRCDVIVGDLHPGNIVYGMDSRGGPRFVVVDGFGDKNLIPRNSMSARTNMRHTQRIYLRMRRKLDNLIVTGKYA